MLRSISSGAGVEHSSKSDQDYLLYVNIAKGTTDPRVEFILAK